MIWLLTKTGLLAALVVLVGYLAYFQGQQSMQLELRAISREMAVAVYRVDESQRAIQECYVFAEHFRESAVAANKMLVSTDPQWEDTTTALGGGG